MGSNSESQAERASDIEALARFAIANDDLDQLEALINQFNVFEALGVARQELRHSDFLSFLLNPRQQHGLGDRFLKRFLQAALSGDLGPVPLTPIEIELMALDHMTPYRERHDIDILLLDEERRIAVIVENKVGSGEHSGQLQRYGEIVRGQYPGWRVIPIFLTPDGTEPSDASYVAVDYKAVCAIVESLAESRRSSLEPEVHGLLKHYARLLRRYVVEDSEIADLCRQIYAKHKQAIDLILEHRPGTQEQRSELLVSLIAATDGLVFDRQSHSRISFLPVEWNLPHLRRSEGGTPSGRILLFEIQNREQRVDLILSLGPGDADLRVAIIEAVREAGSPFSPSAQPGPQWARLYSARILTEDEISKFSIDEQQDRIRRFWGQFATQTLPAMTASLRVPGADARSADLHPTHDPLD